MKQLLITLTLLTLISCDKSEESPRGPQAYYTCGMFHVTVTILETGKNFEQYGLKIQGHVGDREIKVPTLVSTASGMVCTDDQVELFKKELEAAKELLKIYVSDVIL